MPEATWKTSTVENLRERDSSECICSFHFEKDISWVVLKGHTWLCQIMLCILLWLWSVVSENWRLSFHGKCPIKAKRRKIPDMQQCPGLLGRWAGNPPRKQKGEGSDKGNITRGHLSALVIFLIQGRDCDTISLAVVGTVFPPGEQGWWQCDCSLGSHVGYFIFQFFY